MNYCEGYKNNLKYLHYANNFSHLPDFDSSGGRVMKFTASGLLIQVRGKCKYMYSGGLGLYPLYLICQGSMKL